MQQEGPAVSGVQQNPGGPRSAAMPPPMGSHPGPNGNRGGPILPFEYGPDAGPYRDQVEVSQELVPMVIGKRGATISTMKQQTGANIYVVTGSDIGDQSTREQGYSIFFVDAQTEEQLQAAVDAIREKVSPLEPKEGEIQKFFEIPDHKVPEVLGPQGIALARIKERSGARLEIKAILPTDYHGPAKNMPRTVNCVGTEEAVSKCEELVNKVVSGTVTCADLISEYEVGHPEVRSQKRLSSSLPYDDTKRRRMDYGEYQGGYDSSYNAGYQRGGGPPGGGYGGRGPMKGGGKGGWSESPADSCMLEVPSSGVGAIIGRGGEIINQLKEDGRCDIQISKSGGPYREVSIQGPYDGILTVVGFINERLAGAHTVKSMPANGLPPYLFGSGGGPSGPGMAPRGGPPMSGGPGRMGGGPRPYMQQSSPPPRSYGSKRRVDLPSEYGRKRPMTRRRVEKRTRLTTI
ncbi:hypothetical protein Pmar_PMAR028261 [Perkinsus marinus ATCC 50983]|uniref:K Homology domain-containing protein n=1 Tax=Perkinsus marinus (strain ATCC 50983 / TXsc) TaxID=423536 RepID=C5LBE4_PERM5|nr:hypothetical protein Pmar_PMAR028261 [Perkinsus marinus ATCC 50983]EER06072.1 hypothetical protein Pmar_PMAR028261 [Perkinsus marinus ATCC 50983]|eukprot:XP_002774256.1 hypothetical protein Pmar_PMAR028261 [Perkinsus marinus ATCC 50983]